MKAVFLLFLPWPTWSNFQNYTGEMDHFHVLDFPTSWFLLPSMAWKRRCVSNAKTRSGAVVYSINENPLPPPICIASFLSSLDFHELSETENSFLPWVTLVVVSVRLEEPYNQNLTLDGLRGVQSSRVVGVLVKVEDNTRVISPSYCLESSGVGCLVM